MILILILLVRLPLLLLLLFLLLLQLLLLETMLHSSRVSAPSLQVVTHSRDRCDQAPSFCG